MPLPDVTVALFPAESVTVNVTDNGWSVPPSLLLGPPHVCEMSKLVLAPSCVRVITAPSVHCADHANETSPLVPRGNDVDRSVHVVPVPRPLVMRHSVVALPEIPGSNSWKLAAMSPPLCEMVTV